MRGTGCPRLHSGVSVGWHLLLLPASLVRGGGPLRLWPHGFGGWNALTPIDNFAANGSLLCDNFNRPDAGLGVNWATSAGTAAIVANQAVGGTGGTQSRSELLGNCGAGTACYADCNNDGGLTIADFGCLQTKFVAGCP
jgi:hypothetical protein